MGDVSLGGNGRMPAPPAIVAPPACAVTSEESPPHRTSQPESGDFGHLLRLIWRRKLVLVAFVLVGIVLCAAVITQTKRVYTARGLLLVGAPQTHIVELQDVLSGVSAEIDAVDSEVELLQSPALANAVVDRLSLDR